ncbi:transposase [Mesorhizobium sp. M0751]|uniref:IS110 family transposase n=1 Tax=unclassified Mesorhizobium TaxID=325217 RepID=UPI00333D2E98
MTENNVFYVGVDVSKAKHALAAAEGGRDGEVRYFGEIEATTAAVERFVRKLERKHPRLHFCYEAGPTGYGLYRQLVELGHRCDVVAPSLIPKRPGERVKTNRRDAVSLARLLRAAELKGIWVPDAVHEAVRDMVRARSAASEDLRKKRQQLLSFLLRHGRVFTGHKNWSRAHARWLAAQKFGHPAQQIVFQDQVDVITDAQHRLERLDAQVAELAPSWSMAPVVGRPPAETDMQRHFQVSPPSVHQMILTLERNRLIRRQPGVARSIQILVAPEDLPILDWLGINQS